jgi:hypothetical protein
MKVGDQVRMKYQMFWYLKGNRNVSYRDAPATVIKFGSHMIEIMWPDGKIDRRDKDFFEVIENA